MEKLYRKIDHLDISSNRKYALCISVLSLGLCLISFLLWLTLIRPFILKTIDWGLSFLGYPIIFSIIFVFISSSKYPFHNGKY